ncbi:aminotransferase class V-fold PLP-dependent enzyme, partial [candidate division KSB1 bacterium]|nr:aminotransferase class V-fold PLP-dependent enzyme [candidate division KSB1 bacterium]NIW68495.1 aminotransferase class V-fold PLP-dependent enzyme [candidate division KSB1 bacterium]NIX70108.1 aminotransferase class V-fold PLP-dependent enzyme [candidate division KSB1 bacterium]
GIATPKDVKEALQEETALVTIMHANNEIGTIQPVKEIAKVVRDYKKQNNRMYPYVHTDACQSFGYLDVFVERLGIDLMTFNGSKIYGPKGAGALYVKRGITLKPLIYGGGQESGLRSGTENIAGAIGLAEAVRITETIKEKEARRVGALRDYFIDELMRQIPSTRVNGSRSER